MLMLMQNGLLAQSALTILLSMMHACQLLQIHMCGISTMVLQSTLPHIVNCSPLSSLSLMGIQSFVPTMTLIWFKELERLCLLLQMVVPSHLLMHFMYLGSRRISCLYPHLLDLDL
ncbi:hypothetical protein DD599_25675 [Enterobacter cloacae complex sp. CH23B]|nr:hypothetical protein DD599_25675 [Enterobacter cloacae complex sp. CH23B]